MLLWHSRSSIILGQVETVANCCEQDIGLLVSSRLLEVVLVVVSDQTHLVLYTPGHAHTIVHSLSRNLRTDDAGCEPMSLVAILLLHPCLQLMTTFSWGTNFCQNYCDVWTTENVCTCFCVWPHVPDCEHLKHHGQLFAQPSATVKPICCWTWRDSRTAPLPGMRAHIHWVSACAAVGVGGGRRTVLLSQCWLNKI